MSKRQKDKVHSKKLKKYIKTSRIIVILICTPRNCYQVTIWNDNEVFSTSENAFTPNYLLKLCLNFF